MKVFQRWINYARHWLIYCAAYGFTQNYQGIMEGNYHNEILHNTFHESSMNILKKSMKEFTYCSAGIIKLELSAQTIKEYNLYLRVLLIADFVSGMTDTFARTLYQELSGI